ncbi:MAG: hypothetical protein V4622_01280 [Bacteroidota bacterium]
MKKNFILFTGILTLAISCSSKVETSNEESGEIDLDNLTFCDCKNNRFDIHGEIQREIDPEAKKDLEAELSLFNEKCKKYDLKEGASEKERIDYQLDWNKKVAECK